ncbi:MAG: L-threonylcarbamoyladenylate synthase [Candidatus Woesearchaeota archaeon]
MEIIAFEELKARKYELIGKIIRGELFIYPTDTIYGLGCDATNFAAVYRLRELKKRPIQPLSIIPPSIDWIYENCEIDEEIEKELSKLPGPYTFILKLKNRLAIASNVSYMDTIGIRIPDHKILEFLSETRRPIVTTSVNISNEPFMKDLSDLDDNFKIDVSFIIYQGPIFGKPSKIIDLVSKKIIERD